MAKRVGGIIEVSANGVRLDAKGNWTYNLGLPKRTAVIGSSDVPGYMEEPQVAFIEGEITDTGSLNMRELVQITDATIVLKLANGKAVALREAWFAGEGTGNTQEGNVGVRCESPGGEELT